MRRSTAAVAVLLMLGCLWFTWNRLVSSDTPGARLRSSWLRVETDGRVTIRVEHGEPGQADEYYKDITQALGINIPSSRLPDLLAYMGYPGETFAGLLEATESDAIMSAFPGGNVIATRFFAPKITAVASPVTGGDQPPPESFGWRKLVRLRATPDSVAAKANIASMYLLFNFFQPRGKVTDDPFTARPSETNQVMLVRAAPDRAGRHAYWLVYGRGPTYALSDHLCATFDGDVSSSKECQKYYVPAACGQCHGGRNQRELLNYLDTDHWQDRIQDGEDFVYLRKVGAHPVVFDGGPDPGSVRFRAAFEVIRQLNREIRAQNCALAPVSFQCRATDNWLTRHAATSSFLLPIERPIPPAHPRGAMWQGADDAALLGDLNRFCFRCHSSLAYHVYDKEAVLARRNGMAALVLRGHMPQDRSLDKAIRDRIAERLRNLADE